MRVLLITKDTDIAAELGCEVALAASLNEAQRALHLGRFDVVVCDSAIDGDAYAHLALDAVRFWTKEEPVVLIAVARGPASLHAAWRAADAYLTGSAELLPALIGLVS